MQVTTQNILRLKTKPSPVHGFHRESHVRWSAHATATPRRHRHTVAQTYTHSSCHTRQTCRLPCFHFRCLFFTGGRGRSSASAFCTGGRARSLASDFAATRTKLVSIKFRSAGGACREQRRSIEEACREQQKKKQQLRLFTMSHGGAAQEQRRDGPGTAERRPRNSGEAAQEQRRGGPGTTEGRPRNNGEATNTKEQLRNGTITGTAEGRYRNGVATRARHPHRS